MADADIHKQIFFEIAKADAAVLSDAIHEQYIGDFGPIYHHAVFAKTNIADDLERLNVIGHEMDKVEEQFINELRLMSFITNPAT